MNSMNDSTALKNSKVWAIARKVEEARTNGKRGLAEAILKGAGKLRDEVEETLGRWAQWAAEAEAERFAESAWLRHAESLGFDEAELDEKARRGW